MVSCRVPDHASDAGSERLALTLLATAHATAPCGDASLAQMRDIDTVAVDTTLGLDFERLGNARE